IPRIPPALREAAERGKLIPFVGAGASVLAGCPTWAQLADGALLDCIEAGKFNHGQNAQIRHLTPRIKLSIARGIEAEHGFTINYAKLIDPRAGYTNHEVGQRVYQSLGKLGRTFVTTNYDAWLDTEILDLKLTVSGTSAASPTTAHSRQCEGSSGRNTQNSTPLATSCGATKFLLSGHSSINNPPSPPTIFT
ncbi:MAG: hypothetical protein WBE14_27255, partial [Xanthobacteraceae bacterium]